MWTRCIGRAGLDGIYTQYPGEAGHWYCVLASCSVAINQSIVIIAIFCLADVCRTWHGRRQLEQSTIEASMGHIPLGHA